MSPTVLEADLRTSDEIADRPGDEDFAGRGRGHDARADMDRDAAHVAVAEFDLAGVQAGADVDPGAGKLLAQERGRPDAPSRPVEGGEDAVARRLDQSAVEAPDHATCALVVDIEQVEPALVT